MTLGKIMFFGGLTGLTAAFIMLAVIIIVLIRKKKKLRETLAQNY